MILSMTGFAALAAELPGCSMSVELRSVNHRYLDIQLRLPDELRTLETAIRELLSSELKRGKVDCRIGLVRNAPGAASLAMLASHWSIRRSTSADTDANTVAGVSGATQIAWLFASLFAAISRARIMRLRIES